MKLYLMGLMQKCSQISFSDFPPHSSSLLEVTVTGDPMKHAVTLT